MSSGEKQQQRLGKRMQSLKPPKNISAFLNKLWRMVNDPDVDELISWNESGSCFVILNQYKFWAELLPLYYKHNNMASFVRQLNMYGFHKVTSDAVAPDSDLQFYHEYFQRDNPDLLEKIKRKVTVPRVAVPADTVGLTAQTVITSPPSPATIDKKDLARVLTDVKDLQGRQSSFNNQLAQLKHENSVLWGELAMLRQRHTKQQAIVNKLIHFLVTLVQTPNTANRMGVKRTFPLMIDHDNSTVKKAKTRQHRRSRVHGLRIHELDPDIGEAIDEDSVNTLETVTSQHSAPHTPTSQTASEFSPDEILHSPDRRNDSKMDDVTDVVIDESNALVNELLDTEDDGIIILPSDIKSPSGTDMASTSAADFEGIVDETSNDNNGLFLNPAAANKLITNLMNGSYNSSTINDTLRSKLAAASAAPCTSAAGSIYSTLFPHTSATTDMSSGMDSSLSTISPDNLTVATMSKPPKPQRMKSVVGDELGQHVKETQSELDSIKDIIYGSNGMDLNYLLGLFSEEPSFKMVPQQSPGNLDPTMLNTISTYEPVGSPIDFSELVDSINNDAENLLSINADEENAAAVDASSSINTPLIFDGSPIFPSTYKK